MSLKNANLLQRTHLYTSSCEGPSQQETSKNPVSRSCGEQGPSAQRYVKVLSCYEDVSTLLVSPAHLVIKVVILAEDA